MPIRAADLQVVDLRAADAVGLAVAALAVVSAPAALAEAVDVVVRAACLDQPPPDASTTSTSACRPSTCSTTSIAAHQLAPWAQAISASPEACKAKSFHRALPHVA